MISSSNCDECDLLHFTLPPVLLFLLRQIKLVVGLREEAKLAEDARGVLLWVGKPTWMLPLQVERGLSQLEDCRILTHSFELKPSGFGK